MHLLSSLSTTASFPVRATLQISILAFFLSQSSYITYALEKQTYPDQVIIEHAELIPSSAGQNFSRIFLSIWNGTNRSIQVESIDTQKGPAFLKVDGNQKTSAKNSDTLEFPIYIPPRSEFVTRPKGLFLQIAETKPTKFGSTFLLIVKLSDGRQLFVDAEILSHDAQPTHHHHAAEDGQ